MDRTRYFVVLFLAKENKGMIGEIEAIADSANSMVKMKLNTKGKYLFFCYNPEAMLRRKVHILQSYFIFAAYLLQIG